MLLVVSRGFSQAGETMATMETLDTPSPRRMIAGAVVLVAFGAAVAAAGCNEEPDNPYKPQPAWSGKPANLPSPPALPSTPIKQGDAYTIYGAIHQLRSLLHAKDVTANPISVTGYIVDSNIARAPDCLVHKTGKKDPDNCPPDGGIAEIPSFWIADEKDNTKGLKIRVVGWARNYAVIYDAMKEYKNVKPGEEPKKPVTDDILNVEVPCPLPAVGAKVKVTGSYSVSKNVVTDMVSEPIGGVMALQKLETVEPAAEPAHFAKPID